MFEQALSILQSLSIFHKMTSFKAVFLGEGRVGKTSIGLKWAEGSFDPRRRSTVQAGFYTKKVETSRGLIEMHLWDTAGQEEYHAVAPIYYKDAQAAMLVYDVTNQISFDRMVQWHRELTQIRGDQVQIVCVANKIDLADKRVIPSSKGTAFAASIGCPHFEVSAKTGEGIDMLFRHLTESLVKSMPNKPASNRPRRGGNRGITVLQAEEVEEKPTNENGGNCAC
ncbi:Ras-related protein Rab-21 [Tritrichomonas foetus]|uniref:Ras-related protein Rab-21 n=1 Tax=Tritrichomonas foetus TaxID=1144522 RepID=A0A1J4JH97_9EUKA|nr:Ras-related protein Rab-21 [Tritrichomonas foetus]|eukprot:OHS96979.1 Ras-related protein Rab-21 [Tritrichomonas foetus]